MKLALWIIISQLLCASSADRLWKGPILVSQEMMNGQAVYTPSTSKSILVSSTEPKMICGSGCDRLGWCTTWCFDEVNGTCIKSNAMVSPLYVTTSNNNFRCYTYQEPDFIVGATATSSYNGDPWNRMVKNLLLGIYNFNDVMTCAVIIATNPWILFDLIVPQTIHEIRITTQYLYYEDEMAHGAEIKASIFPPIEQGSFSNMEHFGTLPNPVSALTTYTFKKEKGMRVRYISIQDFIKGRMGICQVMAL